MASAVGKPSGTAGAENGAAKPETDTNQGVSDPGPDHGCNVASGGTRQGSPAWWLAAGLGLLAFRRRK
jgi:MYXO-CTERM domain-containing protein